MTNEIMAVTQIVDDLYAHGKVCLTAYSGAGMDKKYRPYLAQFADGTFLG